MGAGFRWWSEPMTNNDGTPSLTKGGKQRYTHHHVLGADCDRNADISLNFYWRAHDRSHWSNSLVPLNERRRGGFTEVLPPTPNDMRAAI
jgi:hypothetical protein